MIQRLLVITALVLPRVVEASGHGPVFALATPTSPTGGWSLDTGFMGRFGHGNGTMFRGTLGYGVTENLKVSISAPLVFSAEPFPQSRTASTTPMGSDFEGLILWRPQRKDIGVGSRFETTIIGGLLVPGPQDAGGVLKDLHSGPGALAGVVTGFASRKHYVWAGTSYQRHAPSHRDRRPDLLFYSLAYAYRPPSWRKDHGWDWRIFGEMTGERSGPASRNGLDLAGSTSHQIFVGPTTLGVYKNYAVSGGVQVAIHQDALPFYPRERVRFAINFSRFF